MANVTAFNQPTREVAINNLSMKTTTKTEGT